MSAGPTQRIGLPAFGAAVGTAAGAPGRRSRLSPVVGAGRNAVLAAVTDALTGGSMAGQVDTGAVPLILVACSGGPDSLALAALAAFFGRRGTFRAGAVVVNHALQPGSADVAANTRVVLEGLGLAPVDVVSVQVDEAGTGPEGAARTARYAALDDALARHGAAAVLLGHTLDDQAEQVLLGLARGSGTRSLAGMPARRGPYLRPLLGLRRADTEAICAAETLLPWQDPANADWSYTRSRIRTEVLPYLEATLGPGIAEALYRSTQILGEDAAYLDAAAREHFASISTREGDVLYLQEDAMRQLAPAMRHRLIALAAVELGAEQPGFKRILAADKLLARHGSAGPIQLPGKVSVFREVVRGAVPPPGTGCGRLIFRYTGPVQPAQANPRS